MGSDVGAQGVYTRPAAGGEVVRTPEEAALVREAFGTPTVSPAAHEAEARRTEARRMFDTAGDAATTFAEGVVDALSLGLVHEPGEAADLRRDANSGWAFAGSVAGTALGLALPGPTRLVANLGEDAGKLAARAVLGRETGVIATGLREAGAGAALTGATAFGHQLVDSVIEDRDFSGEAVLDAMKLGGVLGFGGGSLMGGLARVGSRAEIAAQGGLLGDASSAAGAFEEGFRAYDAAVDQHAAQLGVLKELRAADRLGPVSDDFIRVREALLKDARRAGEDLRALDSERALSGGDEAEYLRWREAGKNYRDAARELDDVMASSRAERVQAAELGARTVVDLRAPGPISGTPTVPQSDAAALWLDQFFQAAPEMKLRYEAMHGGPREPAFVEAPAEAPAGGVVTPTSELSTRAGGGAAGVAPPRGDLDALNAAVDKLPLSREESAARAGAVLSMEPPPAPTLVEGLPAGAAQGALDRAAASARTRVETPTLAEGMPAGNAQLANDALDAWIAPRRVRPFEEADVRARSALEGLRARAGGRLESAGGLGLVKPAPEGDLLGTYGDQVFSMHRAGRYAADEARGVASPLRVAAQDFLIGRVAGKLLGHKGLGGAAGLVAAFAGYGGRLASASGRLARQLAEVAGKLLTSTRLRAVTVAASNRPWVYSDRGPLKDPIERIQELHYLAANPDSVRAKVGLTAGDLNAVSPAFVRALQDRAVMQVQQLSIRAPRIVWDRLGQPLTPPAGELRRFYEYENAVHDLPDLLKALGSGQITQPQIDALREAWPSAYAKVSAELLRDQPALQKLTRPHLCVIERVTGANLTGAYEPAFLTRQVAAWTPTTPPAPQPRAQAFRINPAGAPTPTQSASGRAPGN